MATVATTYGNYSFQTEEQRATARAAHERYRLQNGGAGQEKSGASDAVAFSEQGRQLAASSSLSQQEMESLSYAHLLQFKADDGSDIAVDLAMDPDSEEKYLAARVTITRPDGSEESLYFSFDLVRAGEKEEGPAGQAAATAEEETGAADDALAEAAREAQPSLADLVHEYGLDNTSGASDGLFAAIRARVEAMIEASRESAEDAEALEKIKAEREARSGLAVSGADDTAAGAAPETAETAVGRESNPVPAKTARGLAEYGRNAASFGAGTSRFSRHY